MTEAQSGKRRVGILIETLVAWVVLTFSFGVIYLTNQTELRKSADKEPLMVSEQAAKELSSGRYLEIFLKDKLVPIENSLSAYVMVYDDKGVLIYSSARLKGNIPSIPLGVLEASKKTGINVVTWQPETGVRQALVVRYYKVDNREGYVVSGRSLTEFQIKMDLITKQIFWMWIVSVVIILLVNLTTKGRKRHQ